MRLLPISSPHPPQIDPITNCNSFLYSTNVSLHLTLHQSDGTRMAIKKGKKKKKRLLPASSSYTHDVCPSSASLVQRLSRFRWTDLGTREALDASVVSPACITRRNRRKRMRRKTPTRRIKLQKAVNSNEPLDRAAARQQRFPHRFLFSFLFNPPALKSCGRCRRRRRTDGLNIISNRPMTRLSSEGAYPSTTTIRPMLLLFFYLFFSASPSGQAAVTNETTETMKERKEN